MKVLNRNHWKGLAALGAVILVSSGAVFGGIEWALASLGLIGLAGMIGAGIYITVRVLRYSDRSAFEDFINYEIPSYYWDDDSLEYVAVDITEETVPISKKDKRLIAKHIGELFGVERVGGSRQPVEAAPIGKRDKKLIMAHVDELFTTSCEQNLEMLS
ncbi:hypothetical protein ACFLW0_07485 [Chloroflexota bacterium]